MGVKDVLLGKMLGGAARQSGKQITETADLLLAHAVKNEASDIHIEPHAQWVLVRYRIDGELGGVYKLPLSALPALTAEFKTRAGLATGTALPQQGQYEAEIGGHPFVVQSATMPVLGGEKLVLHLTPSQSRALPLEALGFWGEPLDTLRLMLARPRGLLLVSGPKRSGKSVTLRSLIALLNRPTASIAAIENVVEQRLPGVMHIPVGHGREHFATHVAAALHQDANIIMLERIPDGATASLAVQAAASGHFVLAGLHADSAVQAILQIEAMGVEPLALSHCLQGTINQRLVRRLCPNCRERYALTRQEEAAVARAFGIKNVAAQKRVHELERQAIAMQLDPDVRANTTAARITHLWRASPDGCAQCNHSGYTGRTGLVEVLKNGPQFKQVFLAGRTPASLHVAALNDGFVPLLLDGLIKALRGQTTVEQVLHQSTV